MWSCPANLVSSQLWFGSLQLLDSKIDLIYPLCVCAAHPPTFLCMHVCTLLPPSSPVEGVYGTQSASLYCIKLWNVQIDSDVLKNASKYVRIRV